MGTPKPLLEWFGAPLVQRQIEALLEAGVDEVIVVTGNRAEDVEAALSTSDFGGHVHAVRNDLYLTGKTTSVKAGLTALPADVDTILLLAIDQPRPSWLIQTVLDSHRSTGAPVSSPVYDGHGGHPLIFDGSLRGELSRISEEGRGVREVVQAHADSLNRVKVETPIARLDMNTQVEVEAARRQFPDPRAS